MTGKKDRLKWAMEGGYGTEEKCLRQLGWKVTGLPVAHSSNQNDLCADKRGFANSREHVLSPDTLAPSLTPVQGEGGAASDPTKIVLPIMTWLG
jgi:hypothetical protein